MREPDLVVHGPDGVYMKRWYLIKRNRIGNTYYHIFSGDDDPRALHDHPWFSISIILTGGYYEVTFGPDGTLQRKWYSPGSIIFRGPKYTHRIELGRKNGEVVPCSTLFITGPVMRDWGFHCPQGWKHWRDFGPQRGNGDAGKGCGDE